MHRITKKEPNGMWNVLGIQWSEVDSRIYGALCKLKDYEDTGLTPGEIMDGKILTGWIPVEERLPENGTYLCTFDGAVCGLEEPFTGMCGIENGKWDEEDCVIAWMPLPAPYQVD